MEKSEKLIVSVVYESVEGLKTMNSGLSTFRFEGELNVAIKAFSDPEL